MYYLAGRGNALTRLLNLEKVRGVEKREDMAGARGGDGKCALRCVGSESCLQHFSQ